MSEITVLGNTEVIPRDERDARIISSHQQRLEREKLEASEQHWEVAQESKRERPHDREVIKSIGIGETPCAACNNQGYIHFKLIGKDTGLVKWDSQECWCGTWKRFYTTFHKNVPPHDRHIRLHNIVPSEKSFMPVHLQQQMIDKMKAAPQDGWAFFGPVGWSKTTYSVALYAHNLAQNEGRDHAIWRVSAKKLLDEFHDFAISRTMTRDENGEEMYTPPKAPTVTREKIVKMVGKGLVPRLFLEEVDKVKNTKFKLDALFEVIDGIYENNGQLVISSNLTPEQFTQDFGAEFMRRIAEMCHVEDYFSMAKEQSA